MISNSSRNNNKLLRKVPSDSFRGEKIHWTVFTGRQCPMDNHNDEKARRTVMMGEKSVGMSK